MNLQSPGMQSSSIGRADEDNKASPCPPPLPPPLDLDASAVEVFSNPYFSPRPDLGRQRHKALGTRTLGDVLSECSRSGDSQYTRLAATTGTRHDAVLTFLRHPIERILAHIGYMSLRRSDAFDDFMMRRPKEPPASSKTDVEMHNSPTSSSRRSFPLCYVVGPPSESPSTRGAAAVTNFALQHLKDFRNLAALPSVLLYWELWTRHGHFDFGRRDTKAASDLVERLLELLTYRIRCNYRRTWSPQRHRLENVHVCLVMDGVERPDQRAFFADMDMVTRFAKELQDSQLAASLMVAVVMSGPLPKSAAKFLASATDAYYLFRVDG